MWSFARRLFLLILLAGCNGPASGDDLLPTAHEQELTVQTIGLNNSDGGKLYGAGVSAIDRDGYIYIYVTGPRFEIWKQSRLNDPLTYSRLGKLLPSSEYAKLTSQCTGEEGGCTMQPDIHFSGDQDVLWFSGNWDH